MSNFVNTISNLDLCRVRQQLFQSEERVKLNGMRASRPWISLLPTLLLFLAIIFLGHLSRAEGSQTTRAEGSQDNLAEKKEKSPLSAQAFVTPTRLEPQQIAELRILLNLKPGFKAFDDQFRVKILKPEGFQVAQVKVSPTKEFFDKFSKKKRKAASGSAQLLAAIEAPLELLESATHLELLLTYQACTDAYCLFPEDLVLKAPIEFVGPVKEVSLKKTEDSSIFNLKFEQIYSQGLGLTFVFVFIFGLLTSFTPCIFPMIPITLAVLGRDAHARSHRQNIFVSLLYVLGIATSYSILGLLAASTGSLFGSFMAHPLVLGFMCLVFLVMSISMLGGFELQAPNIVQNGILARVKLPGFSGVFISGILAGIVASPCVGPMLVGILTFVAKTQNLWLGFWLLFAYAFGMGQLFLILGVSSRAKKLLPKSGAWMDGVKHFLGLLMLGVFYFYLDLLISPRWWDGVFGLGLVVLASLMGAFSPLPALGQAQKMFWPALRKGLLMSCILIGAGFVAVSLLDARKLILKTSTSSNEALALNSQWQKYTPELVVQAQQQGRPVIIDFWADWCAACHQLESETFSNSRVQMLGTEFVKLKFDATKSSPELDQLKSKYGIVGLPTLVFISRSGQWQEDLTLTEFEAAPAFSSRMQKLLER
jgi:thiol:disulfide interchange protein DsbD